MKKQFSLTSVLSKINQKYHYYLFGAALVVVFLLTYFVFTRPQLNQLTKITPEIKALSSNLKKAKEDIHRRGDYESQVEGFRKNIESVKSRILVREDMPLILERVSQLAMKNGIKIDQLMPYPAEEKVLLTYDQSSYFILPIFMEARGGYHDFGRFLNEL